MARKRSHIPGVSFSAKRASGITRTKRKTARTTGIPTTRSGRRRKYGSRMTGGCILPVIFVFAVLFAVIFICL